MRNKLFLLLLALCTTTVLKAQSLPLDTLDSYENVRMFYQGCLKIREGDSCYLQRDTIMGRRAFAKAMDLLNEEKNEDPKIRLNDLVMSNTIRNSDECALSDVGFNYNYAEKRYNYQPWTPAGVLRAITLNTKCSVKEFRLKPHGFSLYENRDNSGKCILIAIAEYGGTVKMSITEKSAGILHEGNNYENGGVSFAKWILNTKEDFLFKIENTSNKECTIVLISN